MRIRHSRRSLRDLQELGRYIGARDPAAALRVRAAIQAALLTIGDYPGAGRAIGRGLRRLSVPRLPYLIIYRVDETAGVVDIATIRHTSRRSVT